MRAFRVSSESPDDAASATAKTPFGISHEPLDDSAWVFTIEGALDLATVDRVREAVEAPIRDGARAIVFDMAKCSFVDSSGLAVLLEVRNSIDGSSPTPRVAIAAPAPQLERLLAMTAVDTIVPVAASREEARAALDDAPIE